MTQKLGKIEKVDIRKVWASEANDFTPWLADNLDLLGEELNLKLELDSIEAPVGNLSLDILAREVDRNAVVVIENQIASSDSRHLGQLMAYAAGRDAGIVIWVATDFRDEDRAALNWLNERTDGNTEFFGVEISTVKIGDSPSAPMFRLITTPSTWVKHTNPFATTELTDKQQKYVRFWKSLVEELNSNHGWNVRTYNTLSYFDIGSGMGFGRFGRNMRFTDNGEARVEIHFNGPTKEWNETVFDQLQESQDEIQSKLETTLNWDRLDHAKTCRVGVSRYGSIEDSEQDLDEIKSWMIENVVKFPDVFREHLGDALNRVENNP